MPRPVDASVAKPLAAGGIGLASPTSIRTMPSSTTTTRSTEERAWRIEFVTSSDVIRTAESMIWASRVSRALVTNRRAAFTLEVSAAKVHRTTRPPIEVEFVTTPNSSQHPIVPANTNPCSR